MTSNTAFIEKYLIVIEVEMYFGEPSGLVKIRRDTGTTHQSDLLSKCGHLLEFLIIS